MDECARSGYAYPMIRKITLAHEHPVERTRVGSRSSMPTMFAAAFFAENGGLASYTPLTYESGRMAARLVDKILKGESPAEIPVEVNSKIEFLINLNVAKALGIKIAPEMLYRANRVIR